MNRTWDGVTERRRDLSEAGERIAVLESQQEHANQIIHDLTLHQDEQREILTEIKGAIRFIKAIAWIATAGMGMWAWLLVQVRNISEHVK